MEDYQMTVEELFEPVPEDDGEVDTLHEQGYKPWQILQAVHNAGEKEMREHALQRELEKLDR